MLWCVVLAPKIRRAVVSRCSSSWHVLSPLTIIWILQIKIYSFDFDHFSTPTECVVVLRTSRGEGNSIWISGKRKEHNIWIFRGQLATRDCFVCCFRESIFLRFCCLPSLFCFFWWNVPQCSRAVGFNPERMWVASSDKGLKFIFHIVYCSSSSVFSLFSLSLSPRRRMEQSEHVKTECQVPSSMERYVWEERKKCIIKISCLRPKDSREGRLTTACSTKSSAHLLNTPEYPRLHITGTKNCYFWKACPNSVLMYLFNFLFTSMEQTLCARTHVSLCYAFSTICSGIYLTRPKTQ